jgi:hypothetical protein
MVLFPNISQLKFRTHWICSFTPYRHFFDLTIVRISGENNLKSTDGKDIELYAFIF